MRTADGRVLRGEILVGAVLGIGARSVRVEQVTSESAPGRRVWLHRVVVVDPEGATSDLCEPDAEGERWALGIGSADGALQLTCSSSAVGKCIRWGYPPAVGGDLHEACVRMVRADCGGDGHSWTRDGTVIAFCDRAGIHPCRGDEPVDAAWSAGGATCVARTRIPDLLSMTELEGRYPRLAAASDSVCTTRRARGAALFDLSDRPRVESVTQRGGPR